METRNLRKKWPKFIRWLDKQDFGQELKDAYRINIMRILLDIGKGVFVSYEKYLFDYSNAKQRTEEALNRTNYVVDMIKRFDLIGLYPDQEVKIKTRKTRVHQTNNVTSSASIRKNQQAVDKKKRKTKKKQVKIKKEVVCKLKRNNIEALKSIISIQISEKVETKNLQKGWKKFLCHLDEQCFCKGHKSAYQREISYIFEKMSDGTFTTYDDYLSDYEKARPRTEAAMWSKRHVVGMIKRFDLYGYLPEKKIRIEKNRERIYEVLNPSYQSIFDTYQSLLVKKELRASTIEGDIRVAKQFLKHLQDNGISNLQDTNEDVVHSLFYKDGCNLRGYDFSFGVRRFMTVMESHLSEELCRRICSYLPKSAKVHKPYDAITNEELDKLKAVLGDDSLGFPLRDRAIMIVAIYTGLRRSDIANLRMDSIDWQNDKIHITQSKTGNPLILPLRPIVGNAIYDYIVKERPQSSEPYVFLHSQNCTKLNPTYFSKMSYKFFDAAGIRMNGENRGMHMFRHNVATSLINNGHDTPIVMSVLGHTAPLAVDYYLESDYNQLKECGIDVSRWPIRKEVLL